MLVLSLILSLFLASATVLLRFNAEGSKRLNNINSKGFKTFCNDLMNELSAIIPVERSRLSNTGRFQRDPLDSNQLILLQVGISQPTEETIPCAKDIISDLDVLIKNKDSTLVSHYPLSSTLDENYGAIVTRKLLINKLYFCILIIN